MVIAKSPTIRYYYAMRSSSEPDEIGRYSDPPLLVLASLGDGPKHGHAMIDEIAALSGTKLGPGTLYGAIARLERDGLIEPMPPEDRRQPYRLTAQGRAVLQAKLATLHQFAVSALRRLEA